MRNEPYQFDTAYVKSLASTQAQSSDNRRSLEESKVAATEHQVFPSVFAR